MPNDTMFTDDEVRDEQSLKQPPAPINPFGQVARPLSNNAAADTDQARAIAETQAAMVIAKRFPRDPIAAMDCILQAFTRPTLAESAMYSYARGGTEITGPSIRAAETLAQCWGNVQFGVRELEQRNGESTVEAFAWDIETNTRQVKVFQVPHLRFLSAKSGKPARTYRLEDPRDIYELVANQGARRLRACILGIIPGDVVEGAMKQCDVTLKTKVEVTPELIKSLLAKFAEFGVTQAAIEKRIQRHMDAITPALVVNLGKIYNSLRDGMSGAGEWFDMDLPPEGNGATETTPPNKGAAGLRAKAAQAKAAEAQKPDSATSAPEPAQGVSYAQVAEYISVSPTVEALDIACEMIPGVADERQRAELDVEARAKRKTLTK
jgi:hypothetical protein